MNPKQNKESTFELMHLFSKIIIVIPIVIILIAIFFKVQQKITFSNKVVALPTITPPQSPNITLNLNGPLVCEYSDKESSATASIKDHNIYINRTAPLNENLLVNGDCLYRWTLNKYSGEKMCGVSSYLSAFEMLSSLGLANITTLFNLIPENTVSSTTSATLSSSLQKVLKSCKKKEVQDSIFKIPTTVNFKETKLPE